MRETLIKLVAEAQSMDATITGTVNYILAELRCQTCTNWDNFSPETETGNCAAIDRLTRPDFFCAQWNLVSPDVQRFK